MKKILSILFLSSLLISGTSQPFFGFFRNASKQPVLKTAGSHFLPKVKNYYNRLCRAGSKKIVANFAGTDGYREFLREGKPLNKVIFDFLNSRKNLVLLWPIKKAALFSLLTPWFAHGFYTAQKEGKDFKASFKQGSKELKGAKDKVLATGVYLVTQRVKYGMK